MSEENMTDEELKRVKQQFDARLGNVKESFRTPFFRSGEVFHVANPDVAGRVESELDKNGYAMVTFSQPVEFSGNPGTTQRNWLCNTELLYSTPAEAKAHNANNDGVVEIIDIPEPVSDFSSESPILKANPYTIDENGTLKREPFPKTFPNIDVDEKEFVPYTYKAITVSSNGEEKWKEGFKELYILLAQNAPHTIKRIKEKYKAELDLLEEEL